MDCEFYRSPSLDSKYERWARQSLRPYGPDIKVGNRPYKIDRPVSRIFILSDKDFHNLYDILKPMGHRNCIPSLKFYDQLKSLEDQQIVQAYAGESTMQWNQVLGMWFKSTVGFKLPWGNGIKPYEAYIALRANAITEEGKRIRPYLKELENHPIDSSVFRAVLTHEIGHHYTLSRLSPTSLRTWIQINDSNLSEGLANLFSVNTSSNPSTTRWIWGELANDLPISYSMYHLLRVRDVAAVMDELLCNDNPIAAVREFSKYVSTQMNFGGSAFFIGDGGFNDFLFDWSRNGGTDLYCTGTIAGVGPLSKGNVVASKIGILSGRYSHEVFIAANEIDHILDYDRQRLPKNIKIVDKNTLDLKTHIHEAEKYKERVDKVKHILSAFEVS